MHMVAGKHCHLSIYAFIYRRKREWVKITVTQELELGLVNLYLALNPLLNYMGRN